MDFKEYQRRAEETAVYPRRNTLDGLIYCTLGLTGEAGEFANKVKKMLRGDEPLKPFVELEKELGDVLWYLAEAATNLGLSFEFIAISNLEKLRTRAEQNKIKGSGDNR